MRYKLTLEYDGTPYSGWQKQTDRPSAQAALERAIYGFCQEQVETYCAGRTDAGVHARGQVVHVDLACNRESYHIMLGVNHHLLKASESLMVVAAEETDINFHARFDALERLYEYHIIQRKSPLVLDHQRAWKIHEPLDVAAMKQAAQHLIGHHDFTSFRATACQAKSPIKTLDEISFRTAENRLIITVRAKSFLHHMVRNIVGTLAEVGTGKWQSGDVKIALDARDRKAAGPTAPAEGLYFMEVRY